MLNSFLPEIILQITPAHDPNDYLVGKHHNLEFINIFTDDGKINSNGGAEFEGMPRFTARVAVTEALRAQVSIYWCFYGHRLEALICFIPALCEVFDLV